MLLKTPCCCLQKPRSRSSDFGTGWQNLGTVNLPGCLKACESPIGIKKCSGNVHSHFQGPMIDSLDSKFGAGRRFWVEIHFFLANQGGCCAHFLVNSSCGLKQSREKPKQTHPVDVRGVPPPAPQLSATSSFHIMKHGCQCHGPFVKCWGALNDAFHHWRFLPQRSKIAEHKDERMDSC